MAASMAPGPRAHGNNRLRRQFPVWTPQFPGLRYGYYHTEGSDLLPYGRSGDCAGGTNGVKVYSVEFPGLGSGGITLLELPV